MIVKVHVNRFLTKYFRRTGEFSVVLEEGSTVSDLLLTFQKQQGVEVLKKVTSDVELRRYCIIVIDGRFARLSDIITKDVNQIKIIPPISGG